MARILLVDDSPTILNLLSLMLKQDGHQVFTARDGVEALEMLAWQAVDLLITDVNMPRMDGLSLIAQLRAQDRHANLPIIILSTEGEGHDRRAGLGRGADVYLVKPVSQADLSAQVRALVG